jgi:hypothetical protein
MCSVLAGRDDIERTAAMNIRPMLHATLFQKLLTCSALVLAATCAIATPAHAQTLKVDWVNQRLTIIATDAPLADVLAEISHQTRASIVGLETLTGVISVELRDTRLVDALTTLLRGREYLIRYSATTDAADRVKVWARATSTTSGPPPVPRSSRGDSAPEVATFIAPAAFATTEPVPTGPSPAEAEAARLQAEGFFKPNADEGSLLGLTKASDAGVRVRALQTLALQNTKNGFQAINAALDDPNPFVRAEALDLMLQLSGPGAESARRLGELLGHKDPAVRLPAALALGEQKGAEAEYQLKRALEDDAVKGILAETLRHKDAEALRQKEKPKQ